MKLLICSAYMLLALEPVLAKSLPPLGKRKYLLDVKRPERPAQIEGIEGPASDLDTSSASGMMRDPIPMGTVAEPPKKVWNERPRVVSKASQMKFDKVAVSGRYAVPRVPFDKSSREVKHGNEAIKQDYKKKVEDSDAILKDLNW